MIHHKWVRSGANPTGAYRWLCKYCETVISSNDMPIASGNYVIVSGVSKFKASIHRNSIKLDYISSDCEEQFISNIMEK